MRKFLVLYVFLACYSNVLAQNTISMLCSLDATTKSIKIEQEIVFKNTSNQPLNHIILNDWNHAFSNKKTELAKRFSDEFVRSFYFAPESDLGFTEIYSIKNKDISINWERINNDFIKINLIQPLLPNEEINIKLNYKVKIPNAKFTRYGFQDNTFVLNDWFLSPAVLENNQFLMQSHSNTDDKAYVKSNYNITITIPQNYTLTSCLETKELNANTIQLTGKDVLHFSVYIEPINTFQYFVNDNLNVATNIDIKNVDKIKKAITINRITNFVSEKLGKYPYSKMSVSQVDYNRNQIYGLNQLPSFVSPFPNDFVFEIQFLKTYLQNFLYKGMQLNARDNHFITDAILIYTIMDYMDEFYPDIKMTGKLSSLKILKGYKINQMTINDHYLYFYLMMTRKNLDQPVLKPKNELTKFNEQIAIKYKSGLLLKYLENFDTKENVSKSIQNFYQNSTFNFLNIKDFEKELKSNIPKDIDWFFQELLNSRSLIDYQITSINKQKGQLFVNIKNKTSTAVPIPIYGLKNKKVVYKKWLPIIKNDSIVKLPDSLDQVVLNYNNDVPEHNTKDN